MLMNIYRAVDRSSLQFDFVAFSAETCAYDAEISALGGRIYRVRSASLRSGLRVLMDLRRVIRTGGPYAAVHSHVLLANGGALAAAYSCGVKTRIAHSHNTSDGNSVSLLRRVYARISRLAIKVFANKMVACGDEAGAYLFGPSFRRKGSILKNGIDVAQFSSASRADRREVQSAIGLPRDDALLLGAVARLEPVKNHDFLLHVAEEMRRRRVLFRMLFIGDGSLRTSLEAEIAAKDLTPLVRILGVREDISVLLGALDVLLMPSLYEGLPVALIEAQAAGLPCVVSSSVTREVDLDLGLVAFVAIDSEEAWADMILENVGRRHDPEQCAQRVRDSGYDSVANVAAFYELYGIERDSVASAGSGGIH